MNIYGVYFIDGFRETIAIGDNVDPWIEAEELFSNETVVSVQYLGQLEV